MPETLALELKDINDSWTNQSSAEAFMIKLRKHLETNPEHKDHPEVQAQIQRFETSLQWINAAWARAQLDVLKDTRMLRASIEWTAQTGVDHEVELSVKEYREFAQFTLGEEAAWRIEVKNDRELFLFQYYYNQIHNRGSRIKVDGINWPESIWVITAHVRLTQTFLNELWALSESGLALWINGDMNSDTRKAIKEYMWIEIEAGEDTPRERKVVSIPEEVRTTLAEEVLGKPLTKEKIKTYQEGHNLTVNGEISLETYGEIYAKILEVALIWDMRESDKISPEHQRDVLSLLEYANMSGLNTVSLLTYLWVIKISEKDEADFEEVYGDFFKQIEEHVQGFEENGGWDAAIAAASASWKNRRSFYEIATDKDTSPTDKIKEIMSDPMLLIGGGIMFLFWVFGAKTKYTDSFLKRAWILLGAMFFWPAVINRLGIDDALEDLWAEDKINNFIAGTDPDSAPSVRVREAREVEWSPLNKLFPNSDFFEKVQEYFSTNETINALSISSFPEYISALKSWEDIPSFLQNISVDGHILTNEQVAAYLQSMYEGRREWDNTFADLNTIEKTGVVTGVVTWGLAVTGIILGWAPLAVVTLGSLAAWSIAVYYNSKEVQEAIRNNPWFDGLKEREAEIINQITNEDLKNQLQDITRNESSIEEKISSFKALAEENSEFSLQILALKDLLISVQIRWSDIVLEQLSWKKDLSGTVSEIESEIQFIGENVSNEEEREELIRILNERIAAINEEWEIRERTAVREEVTKIESTIGWFQWKILLLKEEQERLIIEKSSANARRMSEIDVRLGQIPWEITVLEQKILALQPGLLEAKKAVANLEVEQSGIVIDSHLNYVTTILPWAISEQWIVSALSINIDDISRIKSDVEKIAEVIETADASEAKTQLWEKISQITSAIADFGRSFQWEVSWDTVTAETLRDSNLDLTNEGALSTISETLTSLSVDASTQEVLDFYEITIQSPGEVKELYRWEFERQLEIEKDEFIGIPAHQVYLLKQKIEKRNKILGGYSHLFEVEHDEVSFQDIIRQKRDEFFNIPFSEVAFTETFTGDAIVNSYLEKLSSPDKEVISEILTIEKTMEDLLSYLWAFKKSDTKLILSDNSEVKIQAQTVSESKRLLWILNDEINFLTS